MDMIRNIMEQAVQEIVSQVSDQIKQVLKDGNGQMAMAKWQW
jgi:hypothetical protein